MTELRSWQAEAITSVHNAWRTGERPVIHAVMGAGKSFVIAELARQVFHHGHHAVVTVPTQALVEQLAATFEANTAQIAGKFYANIKSIWPVTFVCQNSLAAYESARREWCARREHVARQATDGRVDFAAPARFWIADECHKSECDTVHEWLSGIDDLKHRVGLTATPWRADASESIQAFDSLCYSYAADDAFRDGHIVQPTIHHSGRGDADELACKFVTEQQGGGVCNAVDISDAEDFVLALRRAGVDAIAVHSLNSFGAVDAKKHIAQGGCVVYVNMLSEGFDCPQICWMVLRRPVKSRVRFAQEIGRGLRAHEGKTTCHVLDIFDLFNSHSIDWRACVGEVETREVVPHLRLLDILQSSGLTGQQMMRWGDDERMPSEFLAPVRSFLRSTRVAMQFDGKISLTVESTRWRSDPVSRNQFNFAHLLMGEKKHALADEERAAFAAAYYGVRDSVSRAADDLTGALRKGDAADLISILRGLS